MGTKVYSKNSVMSNVVRKDKLREVQSDTLRRLAEAVIPSAGVFGSTTQIISRATSNDANSSVTSKYTKDGHTIASRVEFSKDIENAIQDEVISMTRYIKNEVGDGSTSTIEMAHLIFEELKDKIDDDKYPSYIIIEKFQNVVKALQRIIRKNGREMTIEDVFKIAMISTNNNVEVSNMIANIYKEHGMDVYIEVQTSFNGESYTKEYDGLTLEVGYSDPVYVNTYSEADLKEMKDATMEDKKMIGSCDIRNAHVYAFVHNIDTRLMQAYFEKIINENIMKPVIESMNYAKAGKKKEAEEAYRRMKPTVIMCPKLSQDMFSMYKDMVSFMYSFNNGDIKAKPPLLVITNIGDVNTTTYTDIYQLCGCKPIKLYIDSEMEKADQEKGLAPTIDNITEWCGHAEEVIANAYKTTFINPRLMFEYYEEPSIDEKGAHKVGDLKLDEDGNRILSQTYTSQIACLEQQLDVARRENLDLVEISNIKRRIQSLKSNLIDLYIGGITTTDRDAVKVLANDAVKNIRSAVNHGVGNGTNFEGLRASYLLKNDYIEEELDRILIEAIYDAYNKMSQILYSTVYYTDKELESSSKEEFVNILIAKSLDKGTPMNFKNKKFDSSVLCTIEQDAMILEVISKIITIVYTTNQTLTASWQLNVYDDGEVFEQ